MESKSLNIDDIQSVEFQTLEDLMSGEFCECLHKEDEHEIGKLSGVDKCLALIFNGTIWESCKCKRLRIKSFCISIKVPDYASDTQN